MKSIYTLPRHAKVTQSTLVQQSILLLAEVGESPRTVEEERGNQVKFKMTLDKIRGALEQARRIAALLCAIGVSALIAKEGLLPVLLPVTAGFAGLCLLLALSFVVEGYVLRREFAVQQTLELFSPHLAAYQLQAIADAIKVSPWAAELRDEIQESGRDLIVADYHLFEYLRKVATIDAETARADERGQELRKLIWA